MHKKILLVYYSRTWITRKIAQHIEKIIKCDVEEIIDTKSRSWIFWYILAGRDASLKKLTKIKTIQYNPSDYQVLIIGTPVRDFTMATAIRTYISQNKNNLPPKIIFYCTMWSGWDRSTFQDMTHLCAQTPIWTIQFKTKEIIKNQFSQKLDKFLVDTI